MCDGPVHNLECKVLKSEGDTTHDELDAFS